LVHDAGGVWSGSNNIEDRMAKAAKAPAKEQAKRPVGRPSSYDPAYCDRVLELGAEGMGPEEIAGTLGVTRTTLYQWRDHYPQFLTALERARALEQLWWEAAGRKALYADKFQQAVWSKSMQARFRDKYTEQQVTTLQGPNGGPINTKIEFSISLVPVPPRDDIV
jgi:transposase-like protein